VSSSGEAQAQGVKEWGLIGAGMKSMLQGSVQCQKITLEVQGSEGCERIYPLLFFVFDHSICFASLDMRFSIFPSAKTIPTTSCKMAMAINNIKHLDCNLTRARSQWQPNNGKLTMAR